jgi:hypothetical protein
MIGRSYNQLKVIAYAGAGISWVVCKCECGVTCVKAARKVRNGMIKSCGHGQHPTQHGHAADNSRSPTYTTWLAMRRRCRDPMYRAYRFYGARGIDVCNRWYDNFSDFLADMGERPYGTTLARKGDLGNYCKSNCFWATKAEQLADRRKAIRKIYQNG